MQIIPIYVVDTAQYGDTKYGVKRASRKRYQFLCESLQDVRKSLEARGSGLLVVECKPCQVVQKLHQKGNVIAVVSSREPGTEELQQEQRVQRIIESRGGSVTWAEPSLLHRLSDLPFSEDLSDVPDVFTPFRKLLDEHGCTAADEVRTLALFDSGCRKLRMRIRHFQVETDRVPWPQLSADRKLALARELSSIEFASWTDLPQVYKCSNDDSVR